MPSFPFTFGSLAGAIPLSDLDANFAVCAFASDLTALGVIVAALPGSATPLTPTALGAVGVATSFSREDHRHPPQTATPNTQTGTTYTLLTTDNGGVLELGNASAIVLTLPNSLAVGSSGVVTQTAAGQITFTAASGTTLRQRQSFTKTAGQWAMVSWYVRTNAGGSAAEYVLSGDMA